MADKPLEDPSNYDIKPEEGKGSAPGVPSATPESQEDSELEEDAQVDAQHADAVVHRGPAILGYIVFLIPLLLAPKSRFAHFHANQALLLFITGMCVLVALIIGVLVAKPLLNYVPSQLAVLVWFAGCGLDLLQVAVPVAIIALAITGIVHAANLEMKPLPLVGNFTLIHSTPTSRRHRRLRKIPNEKRKIQNLL